MEQTIKWIRFNDKDESTWPNWQEVNQKKAPENQNLFLWTDGCIVHPCTFRSLPTDRKNFYWAEVFMPKLA
jgi:hypothetical protein